MWDLLGPGLEPVSPALAGGFLTTAPPGKPKNTLLITVVLYYVLTFGGNTSFIIFLLKKLSWLYSSTSRLTLFLFI